MAKMTVEMYGAQGKVGNKTYYQKDGQTIGRIISTPKNPRTDAQTIQRVIVAQVGKSYNKFRAICDHSFEGVTNGSKCMNMFRKLNLNYCRERAAEIQQSGNSLSQFYNFQPVGSPKWVPNATILAQGQLPKIAPSMTTTAGGVYVGSVAVAENTYASVISSLGLKRGDQLTFVTVNKYDGEYEVHYARIILDPRTAEGGSAELSSAFIQDGLVNLPNWKNKGSFEYIAVENGALEFVIGRGTQVACAIIASRKVSGNWLRSNSTLVLSEAAIGTDLLGLWDAASQSYTGGELDVESELYLNNAGVGGSQSSIEQGGGETPSIDTPTYNNNVTLNGARQNVAGGSVSVTAPFATATINGTNLAESTAYAQKVGSDAHIAPTEKTNSAIRFSGLNGAVGDSFKFFKATDGQVWFTVTVSAAGSNDDPNNTED